MQPAQMGAFMRVLMRTVVLGSMLFGLSAAAIGPVLAQMQPLPPAQQGPPPGSQAMPPPGAQVAPPPGPPVAQPAPQPMQPGAGEFSPNEIVDAGHRFFGGISRGLATIVEKAVSQWGLPNGYILGEEGGGAFFGGLRYGEGMLFTKNAGDLKVFWQGPSVGWDFGGEGARTMMLVYKLPATHAIYQRFGGIRRLRLLHWRTWHDGPDRQQYRCRADPLGAWPAAGRQYRLSQVHAAAHLEPVLSERLLDVSRVPFAVSSG